MTGKRLTARILGVIVLSVLFAGLSTAQEETGWPREFTTVGGAGVVVFQPSSMGWRATT